MANLIEVTPAFIGYQKQASGTKVQIPVSKILPIPKAVAVGPDGVAATLTVLSVGDTPSRATTYYVTETPAAITTAANTALA